MCEECVFLCFLLYAMSVQLETRMCQECVSSQDINLQYLGCVFDRNGKRACVSQLKTDFCEETRLCFPFNLPQEQETRMCEECVFLCFQFYAISVDFMCLKGKFACAETVSYSLFPTSFSRIAINSTKIAPLKDTKVIS